MIHIQLGNKVHELRDGKIWPLSLCMVGTRIVLDYYESEGFCKAREESRWIGKCIRRSMCDNCENFG